MLTFKLEANDTITEFQDLLDLGVAADSADAENSHETAVEPPPPPAAEQQDTETESSPWDAAFGAVGTDQHYNTTDHTIAEPRLGILKCSRGCINVSLQAMEAVGLAINDDDDENSNNKKASLRWISQLHDLARRVGTGITDLGSSLYPPLGHEDLKGEVDAQVASVRALLSFVLDRASGLEDSVVLELANKIHEALEKRCGQLTEAMNKL